MKILVLASGSGGGLLTVSCAVSRRVIRWPCKVAHLKAEIYNFMSEKKFRKNLFFSCRKIILKKVASDFLHVGHPNLRVSYIAQIAKCPQNYLVDIFSA